MTLKNSSNIISSSALEDGPSHFGSPDGPKQNQCLQPACLASHSLPLEIGAESKTIATFGPTSENLSKRADHPSSSESRSPAKPLWAIRLTSPQRKASNLFSQALGEALQKNLRGRGSPLYRLTWKISATSSAQVIYRLRASGHHTSVNVSTGALFDNKGNYLGQVPVESLKWLRNVSEMAGWPTSKRDDGVKSIRSPEGAAKEAERKGANDLNTAAVLAGWGTPVANDDNKSPEAHLRMKQRMGERDGTGANRTAITSLAVQAKVAGYPSPKATDAKGQTYEATENRRSELRKAVYGMAGYPTPMAGNPGKPGQYNPAGNTDYSRKVEAMMGKDIKGHGLTLSTSPAPTARRGQLNAALSRWLMGYPRAWCEAAIKAWHRTPTTRRKRG